MLKIVLFGNPITKKNHPRIVQKKLKGGKTFPIVLPSESYKKYEDSVKQYIPNLETPIDYPINLCCHYYLETRRKTDLTNLLQATCDILVKYNILSDDNYSIVSSFEGTKAEYCKENPRVEIEIEKKTTNL